MKLLVLSLVLSLSASGASYYVSNSGSDAADGSISTPWQTLTHAETRTYAVGDTVHLARGGTWNEDFTFPTNGMTLTAYGSGELPIIDAQSARTEAVSCGTRTGTVTSFLHLKGGTGVSGLWEASAGTNTIEDCVVENHPDSCISAGSDAHIVVRRCVVRGAGDDGITLHVTASAEVYSCTITNNRSGINNSGTVMEMTVEDSTFADNGDGSAFGDLSMGTTASTFRRCWFKGRSDGGAWKFFEDNAGAATTFDYCVFDAGGANATTDPAVAVNSTVVLRNCLLYGRGGYGNISIAATGNLSATNTLFLNWWRAAFVFSGGVWRADHCSYHTSFSAAWQSHTSNTSEIDGDPLVVSPSTYNYRLQEGSPLRNAGVSLGLTEDFYGVPVLGAPDVGVAEYGYFGASVLILTEPTARGYAGPTFDRWIAQLHVEGWNTIVREAPSRWNGNYATNAWPLLNWMSNEVARVSPSAVQVFGHLPPLMTGGQNVDGHEVRRAVTYMWLGCTNLAFTDTVNWTNMVGTVAGLPSLIATNVPGDGIPDQINGTFARPVAVLDAANLISTAGNFASGYLAGQPYQPAIDESYWLKCYLTNNLLYRQSQLPLSTNGYIRTDAWLNYVAVLATNTAVSWIGGSTNAPGLTNKWLHSNNQLSLFSPELVDASGNWSFHLFVNSYKSYTFEDANGQGCYRRFLFPGFAPRPIALNSGWGQGASAPQFFWMGKASDNTIADAITSSATRYGTMPFEFVLEGDVTLPLKNSSVLPKPTTATIGTLVIQ